jgi:hypothetical protein
LGPERNHDADIRRVDPTELGFGTRGFGYEPTDGAPNQGRKAALGTSPGGKRTMGIGASIIVIAVGAILAFAVTATVQGIEIATVGWILMIVGGLGLILSIVFWSSVGSWTPGRRVVTTRQDNIDLMP